MREQVFLFCVLGLLLTAIADLVANFLPQVDLVFDPTSHLLYLLGYFFIARGTKLQYELLTEGD